MADIELVITIDEEDYKIMQHNIAVNNPLCPLSEKEMVFKIAKGTPLPKEHGRLIDKEALVTFPDNPTNGDMIKAMFPYGKYGTNGDWVHVYGVGGNGCLTFTLDWWNSPYKKESEAKK